MLWVWTSTMLTRAQERFTTEIEGGRLSLVGDVVEAIPAPTAAFDAALSVHTLCF